jgi:hypothetical protein
VWILLFVLQCIPKGVELGRALAVRWHGPDSASQSFRVTVVPVQTPTISWAHPANIVAGTPLTALQLDAKSSVPGTFTYSPAAATVLSAGANQALEVKFTPTDTMDYTTAMAIVHINVDPVTPPPPPHVTGIVDAGRTKKGLTAITVVFDEALDAVSADNPAVYSVLGSEKKHRKTVYSKRVGIKGVTFDGHTRVTINFAKPYKGAVQATVFGRILAAEGASNDISFS